MTCEVYCLHSRRLQQIAISLKTILLQTKFQKIIIMSSTSFHFTSTMKYWKKKKTNATFGVDEKGWVLVVLLQILDGDGSLL